MREKVGRGRRGQVDMSGTISYDLHLYSHSPPSLLNSTTVSLAGSYVLTAGRSGYHGNTQRNSNCSNYINIMDQKHFTSTHSHIQTCRQRARDTFMIMRTIFILS